MIEDEIKNEFDKYEIKTTSNMILNRVPKKEPTTSIWKILIPSFCACACCCLLLMMTTLLLMNNNKSPSEKAYKINTLNESSALGQLSLEAMYANDMMEDLRDVNTINRRYQQPTLSDFTLACTNIDKVYPLYTNLFSKENGYDITYKKLNFNYNDKDYSYYYNIDNIGIFLNIDLLKEPYEEYEGDALYRFNSQYYEGEIKIEVDDEEELEVDILYIANGLTYQIEKEIEIDEYSFKYTVSKGDTHIQEHKISIEYEDDEMTFKYELKSLLLDFREEFEIKYENDQYNISYKYKTPVIDFNIDDIKFEIKDELRIYSSGDYKLEFNL